MFQSANPADATTRAALDLASFFYANWHRILIAVAILVIAYILMRVFKGLIVEAGKNYHLPPQTTRMIVTLMTYGSLHHGLRDACWQFSTSSFIRSS